MGGDSVGGGVTKRTGPTTTGAGGGGETRVAMVAIGRLLEKIKEQATVILNKFTGSRTLVGQLTEQDENY